MKVYALSTIESGADQLALLRHRIPLAGIIGLDRQVDSDAVSGFISMKPVAEDWGIPFIPVHSYSLSAESDRSRLEALDIDILLVCGWQRLVPAWLIDHARVGVVGGHGSPAGISAGRGRSPQNWALISGATEFQLSLFFIDPKVDSGPVIETRHFAYDSRDDIASSYLKVVMLGAEMIIHAWECGRLARREAQPQPTEGFYLPQRLPDDGALDWRRNAEDVCRFVAALSKPYPGAFSMLDGHKIKIWRARPFQLDTVLRQGEPGRIVLASLGGGLVVEVGDGLVLVDEYTIEPDGKTPSTGQVFTSVDFTNQIQEIIRRHQTRHPDACLAPMIQALAGDQTSDRSE